MGQPTRRMKMPSGNGLPGLVSSPAIRFCDGGAFFMRLMLFARAGYRFRNWCHRHCPYPRKRGQKRGCLQAIAPGTCRAGFFCARPADNDPLLFSPGIRPFDGVVCLASPLGAVGTTRPLFKLRAGLFRFLPSPLCLHSVLAGPGRERAKLWCCCAGPQGSVDRECRRARCRILNSCSAGGSEVPKPNTLPPSSAA
jgi:hypothetical protein